MGKGRSLAGKSSLGMMRVLVVYLGRAVNAKQQGLVVLQLLLHR